MDVVLIKYIAVAVTAVLIWENFKYLLARSKASNRLAQNVKMDDLIGTEVPKVNAKYLGGLKGEITLLARYNNKIVKVAIEKSFFVNGVKYLRVFRYNTGLGLIRAYPSQLTTGTDDHAGVFMEWLTQKEFEEQYQVLYTEE